MTQSLSKQCIYTIVNAKALEKAAAHGRATSFSEKKQWVTGYTLLQKAAAANASMPVLFADAVDCSRLLYWGLLTKVQVQDTGTKFYVDRVRKLKGRHTPQELLLLSSGKHIAENFIRPYAICHTPSFIG